MNGYLRGRLTDDGGAKELLATIRGDQYREETSQRRPIEFVWYGIGRWKIAFPTL